MCIVGFIITGNSIGFSSASTQNTTENNKAWHYWFLVRRNQPKTMVSPHKVPATWKAFIMQFHYFRSTYDGKTHFTQQWRHMHVLGFHLTGNSIVYSTIHTEKMQENIKILHYWFFLRRIHLWPMDSPHKGPAMREALIAQFRDYMSSFVSSILCKIKQFFHTGVITCASWV